MKVKIEAEGWETAPEWENARRILALARDGELELSALLRLNIGGYRVDLSMLPVDEWRTQFRFLANGQYLLPSGEKGGTWRLHRSGSGVGDKGAPGWKLSSFLDLPRIYRAIGACAEMIEAADKQAEEAEDILAPLLTGYHEDLIVPWENGTRLRLSLEKGGRRPDRPWHVYAWPVFLEVNGEEPDPLEDLAALGRLGSAGAEAASKLLSANKRSRQLFRRSEMLSSALFGILEQLLPEWYRKRYPGVAWGDRSGEMVSIVLCGDVFHYKATGVPSHSSSDPSARCRPFFIQRSKDTNPIIYILEE